MFCTACGTARQAGGAYCARCGAQLPVDPRPGPGAAPWAGPSGAERDNGRQPTSVLPPYAPPPLATPAADTSAASAAGSAYGVEVPPPAPRRRGGTATALAAAAVVLVGAAGTGAYLLVRPGADTTTQAALPGRAPAAATPPPGVVAATRAPDPATPPGPATPPRPSRTASFTDLYRQTGDGVVRIETTACSGGGVGSGFLIAPDLVATAAHVVDGAVSVVLRQGATSTTGTVVGFDRDAELALVRAGRPLSGHVFTLATRTPDVGADVAAIGYPLAGDESLSKGTISGLDRSIHTEEASLAGLLQTDTPLNPGNSGGPLLLADGTVVGVIDAKDASGDNIGYAVPAATARTALQSWARAPLPRDLSSDCDVPVGPSELSDVVVDDSGSPDGPAIAEAFRTYTGGINRGDFPVAFAVLSPSAQARAGYRSFASGTESSYIVSLEVVRVTRSAAGATAEVRFTSLQDPRRGGTGQSCSEWQMTYTLVQASGGSWRIELARPHRGSPAAC